MNPREYRVVCEVYSLDGKLEEISMEVKDVNTKSEARRKVSNHFGDALESIPSVEEIFNRGGGNGGAGGVVVV